MAWIRVLPYFIFHFPLVNTSYGHSPGHSPRHPHPLGQGSFAPVLRIAAHSIPIHVDLPFAELNFGRLKIAAYLPGLKFYFSQQGTFPLSMWTVKLAAGAFTEHGDNARGLGIILRHPVKR